MKAALLIVAITAVALTLAYFAIVNPIVLNPSDWTDAQIIRHRYHLRLVQPAWVSSNGGILMNWVVAETEARLAAIAFFWLCAVIFMIRYEMGENENVDEK